MRITDEQIATFKRQGFLIVDGFLSPTEAVAAREAFFKVFAPPYEQWIAQGKPAKRGNYLFPFGEAGLDFAGTHPDLVDAAERIIGTRHIRMGEFHLGIKYAGEEHWNAFHIDYGNNTLGPEPDCDDYNHVAVFFCFDEVKQGMSPILMTPNGRPDSEAVPMLCSPGSICFYGMGTRHSASPWTAPHGGHRPTAWVSFVRADRPWDAARTFTYKSGAKPDAMAKFIAQASPRQRELIGFAPVGDPQWTDKLIDGMAQRYPGFDPAPYRAAKRR